MNQGGASLNLVASVYCVLLCASALFKLEKPNTYREDPDRNRRITGDYLAFVTIAVGCLLWAVLWGAEAISGVNESVGLSPRSAARLSTSTLLLCDLNSFCTAAAAYLIYWGWARRLSKLVPLAYATTAMVVCLAAAQEYLGTAAGGAFTMTIRAEMSAALALMSLFLMAVALYVRSQNVLATAVVVGYALLQFPALRVSALTHGPVLTYALLAFLKPLLVTLVFGVVAADPAGAASDVARREDNRRFQLWGLSMGTVSLGVVAALVLREASPDAVARISVVAILIQMVLFIALYDAVIVRRAWKHKPTSPLSGTNYTQR